MPLARMTPAAGPATGRAATPATGGVGTPATGPAAGRAGMPAPGRAGAGRTWPAWAVLAVSAWLWAASVSLGRGHGPLAGVPVFDVADVVIYSALLAWTVVGSVVIARRPGNRIGWLLCATGLLMLLGACATQYALAALLGGGPALGGGRAAAWLAPWTTVLGLSLWFWILLLFPTGHPPSPRWRWAAWLYGLLALPGIGSLALLPGTHPAATPSSGRSRTRWGGRRPHRCCGRSTPPPRCSPPPWSVSPPSRWSCGCGGPAASSVCSSNGSPTRRSCSPATTCSPTCIRRGAVRGIPPLLDAAVSGLSLVVVPAAIGMAVLRYRLFEIDRIINRTLVYGLLTALLGAVYAAVVLVLGQLSGGLGASPPSWAVAGATLAAAVLFQPARRGIQRVVDQRFNRRRYNLGQDRRGVLHPPPRPGRAGHPVGGADGGGPEHGADPALAVAAALRRRLPGYDPEGDH